MMFRRGLNIPEASRREHSMELWWIAQAERSLNRISQLRLMPGSNDIDATIVGSLRHGQHGHRQMSPWSENSVEFDKTPLRVREEHQPEAAYHGVEGSIGELHGLAIGDADLDIGSGAKPETSLFDHGSRSIGRGDVTVLPHDTQRCLGGEPGSGRDIQHSLPNANPGGAQQKRDKMAGNASHRILVTPCSSGVVDYLRHGFLQLPEWVDFFSVPARLFRKGGLHDSPEIAG